MGQSTIVVDGFSLVFFTCAPLVSMVFFTCESLVSMVFQWFFRSQPFVSMVFPMYFTIEPLPLNEWFVVHHLHQWFINGFGESECWFTKRGQNGKKHDLSNKNTGINKLKT